MIFIIIYIYSYLYLCIYTPSYPHFKAFLASKFNSETSFLYQLFKENSNIIVLKPCKLINEVFFWFSLLFIFIHIFIYAFIPLIKQKKIKAMQDVHLCMYVCMCVCIYIYMFHKVTFDWCLSQLVVAVRLWSRTISAVRFVKSFRSDAGGLASYTHFESLFEGPMFSRPQ